ncbi:MAG: AI-2E family transporter [Peptococcaceae bacterium]|nr:AI-2E family transporter [Peptococcaceae bacterium]
MNRTWLMRNMTLFSTAVLLMLSLFVYREALFSVATPFILSILLAYLLMPLVDFLHLCKLPRVLAIALVYLALALLFFVLVTTALPKILAEIEYFTEKVPQLAISLTGFIVELEDLFQRLNLPPLIHYAIEENIAHSKNILLGWMDHGVEWVLTLPSKMLFILVTPIVTFYILKDIQVIRAGMREMLPSKYRLRVLRYVACIDLTLGRWIRGQIIVAFSVGLLTAIGLRLIGLEYAVLLGTIAGLLDVVPYFGPVMGGVLPLLLGLIESPAMAFKVLIVIIVVQQIESNFITPQILGQSLNLHPLTIIFALLLGGEVGGFLGLLLAVPIAAIIKVTIEQVAARTPQA